MLSFALEEKVKDFLLQNYSKISIFILFLLAVLIRLPLLPYKSGDYYSYLAVWYDTLASYPGLTAFSLDFTNYSPAYMYILKILTYLPIAPVYGMKLVSVGFDFMLAYYAFALVKLKYTKNSYIPLLAGVIVMFTPTVILNSAFWGQCDSIYASFVLGAIYYLLKKKHFLSFLFLGLAFVFKAQVMFIFPLFIIYYLKNKISIAYFLIIPITYIVSIIPAWLSGGSMKALLLAYYRQSFYYHSLTKNAVNFYQWIPNSYYDFFVPFGYVLTIFILFLIFTMFVKSKKELTNELMIRIGFMSVLMMPFFLAKMHDRYFYLADVLSIVFAFYYPKKWYWSGLIILCSLMSYFPFVLGMIIIPLDTMAFVMIGVVILVFRDYFHTLFPKAMTNIEKLEMSENMSV